MFNQYRTKLFFWDKTHSKETNQMHNKQAKKLFVRDKIQAIRASQINNKQTTGKSKMTQYKQTGLKKEE